MEATNGNQFYLDGLWPCTQKVECQRKRLLNKKLNLVTMKLKCQVLVTIEMKYKYCFTHAVIIRLLVEWKVYVSYILVLLENR